MTSRPSIAEHPMSRRRFGVWLLAAALLGLALAGCGEGNGYQFKRDEKGLWRLKPAEPRQSLSKAVASDNPDERREGIMWLGQPERCSQDFAVKLLAVVLRKDPDPTVRSAAATALAKSVNSLAIDPLIEALDDPNMYVRLDAAKALANRNSDNAKRALLVRLGKDFEPQVRAAVCRSLSGYHDRRALEALINALRDSDFAVVYQAEQSLIRMTGHAYQYDVEAWTRWLAGLGPDGDPFAQAGQTPPSMQTPTVPLTQRMRDAFHNAWYWWQADSKPE